MDKNLVNDVPEDKPISEHIVEHDTPEDCSTCHDPLDETRTLVKLQCGHQFHLDCIGSSYNVKNRMECSLCRNIEPGRWLFASGGRPPERIVNVAPIVNIPQARQNDDGLVPQLPMVFHQNMNREPPAWLRSIPITFGTFPPDSWMGGGGSNGEGASSSQEGASSSREGGSEEGGADQSG